MKTKLTEEQLQSEYEAANQFAENEFTANDGDEEKYQKSRDAFLEGFILSRKGNVLCTLNRNNPNAIHNSPELGSSEYFSEVGSNAKKYAAHKIELVKSGAILNLRETLDKVRDKYFPELN